MKLEANANFELCWIRDFESIPALLYSWYSLWVLSLIWNIVNSFAISRTKIIGDRKCLEDIKEKTPSFFAVWRLICFGQMFYLPLCGLRMYTAVTDKGAP